MKTDDRYKVHFGAAVRSPNSDLQSKLNANSSFGKKNRPQTPVKGIIQGDYGTAAAEDISAHYLDVVASKR